MTWKSYAAMSGAGLLATYLVSTPPPIGPDRTAPRQGATPRQQEAPANIVEEAERLQTRVPAAGKYEEPSRNPFRFGARPVPPSPRATRGEPADAVITPPVEAAPAPPPIRVAGIATDTVGGERQRTAVLITVAGAITVREGDAVAPDYRVTRIDDDAVELTDADGTRRIPLRP